MQTFSFRLIHLVLLLLLLVGNSFAQHSEQELQSLDRVIRLSSQKATVYTLLGKVSEQTGLLFVYDSSVICNEKVVKLKGGERTIREAISQIIGHDDIELQLIDNHILIRQGIQPSALQIRPLAKGGKEKETILLIGRLLDKQTSEPISNATVGVRGYSIGITTNQEGIFRLILPDSLRDEKVYFSHLGYVVQELSASLLADKNSVLSLEPKVIPLQEVVIKMINPQKVLHDMMAAKSVNYSNVPVYFTSFYREGVELKDKLQSLTEAVFKIYKGSSNEIYSSDQVKLLKMSKMNNCDNRDSLLAKISAGIDACLQLDIIKMVPDFLEFERADNPYVYTSGGVAFMDNKWVNVVHFKQRKGVLEPMFCGDLFIDSDNSALVEARIEMNPEFVSKATNTLVQKQSKPYKFAAQKVAYTLTYKPVDGIYYLNHIRGDLLFKVKKRKFLSTYSDLVAWFEMVNCRIETKDVERFPRVERLPLKTILSDVEMKYDADFWGDFNVIPLETEWTQLIEKVNMKIEKTTE